MRWYPSDCPLCFLLWYCYRLDCGPSCPQFVPGHLPLPASPQGSPVPCLLTPLCPPFSGKPPMSPNLAAELTVSLRFTRQAHQLDPTPSSHLAPQQSAISYLLTLPFTIPQQQTHPGPLLHLLSAHLLILTVLSSICSNLSSL